MTTPRRPTLRFAHSWPLKQTMVFERLFYKDLQLSVREKKDILTHAEAVWLYDGLTRRLIGEIYGVSMRTAFDQVEEGNEDLIPFRRKKALYLFSIGILPEFQGQGFGKILKAYFLGRVSRQYDWLVEHNRQGASVDLSRFFGGQVGRTHENWYGSGERYYFCVTDLRRC